MDVSICQGNPHLKQPLSSVKKNTIIINVETSIVINLQIPIIINMSVPDILKIIWDIYFLFLRRASKKKKSFYISTTAFVSASVSSQFYQHYLFSNLYRIYLSLRSISIPPTFLLSLYTRQHRPSCICLHRLHSGSRLRNPFFLYFYKCFCFRLYSICISFKTNIFLSFHLIFLLSVYLFIVYIA